MDRRSLLTSAAVLGAASLVGCSSDEDPRPTATPSRTTPTPSPTPTSVDPRLAGTVVSGLDVPWGIAFLASGDALVSLRDAATVVRVTPDGDVSELGKVPGVVPQNEGGLLGIALHPDDEDVLFAYLSASGDNRIVRIDIAGGRIGEVTPILTGIARAEHHNGGRLLFGTDGSLFASTGDALNPASAQDTGSLNGKILRITTEGKSLPDNPFDNEVWSFGHRNVEGLALDADGQLWASEFGDKRADELNRIEKGRNHGWPDVEGEGGGGDLVDPKATWGTSEASPAGLAIARSTAFLGALQGRGVWMVPLDGTDAGEPELLFEGELGRIRTVVAAPDDSLWVTTSNTDGRTTPGPDDDKIVRVTL